MKNVVVRNIKRADAKAIGTFEKLGVSTVHEALGRYQLMKPYMRPIWAGALRSPDPPSPSWRSPATTG